MHSWAISKDSAPQLKASTIRIARSVLQALGAAEAQGSNKETIDFKELKQVKESKDFLATNLATQNRMFEAEMREMKTKQLEDRMTINSLLDRLTNLLDSDSRKEKAP